MRLRCSASASGCALALSAADARQPAASCSRQAARRAGRPRLLPEARWLAGPLPSRRRRTGAWAVSRRPTTSFARRWRLSRRTPITASAGAACSWSARRPRTPTDLFQEALEIKSRPCRRASRPGAGRLGGLRQQGGGAARRRRWRPIRSWWRRASCWPQWRSRTTIRGKAVEEADKALAIDPESLEAMALPPPSTGSTTSRIRRTWPAF